MTDRIDTEKVNSGATIRVNAFTEDPFVRIKSDPEVEVRIAAAT